MIGIMIDGMNDYFDDYGVIRDDMAMDYHTIRQLQYEISMESKETLNKASDARMTGNIPEAYAYAHASALFETLPYYHDSDDMKFLLNAIIETNKQIKADIDRMQTLVDNTSESDIMIIQSALKHDNRYEPIPEWTSVLLSYSLPETAEQIRYCTRVALGREPVNDNETGFLARIGLSPVCMDTDPILRTMAAMWEHDQIKAEHVRQCLRYISNTEPHRIACKEADGNLDIYDNVHAFMTSDDYNPIRQIMSDAEHGIVNMGTTFIAAREFLSDHITDNVDMKLLIRIGNDSERLTGKMNGTTANMIVNRLAKAARTMDVDMMVSCAAFMIVEYLKKYEPEPISGNDLRSLMETYAMYPLEYADETMKMTVNDGERIINLVNHAIRINESSRLNDASIRKTGCDCGYR